MSESDHTRRPAFLEAATAPSGATPARFSAAKQVKPGRPEAEAKAAPPVATAPVPVVAETPNTALAFENLGLAVGLLRSQGERFAEQARSDALELGFLVARRILEQELHSDPQALLALIRSALTRAGAAHQVTLRLHPLDAEQLRALSPEGTGQFLSIAKVDVVNDAGLARGDCVVETELGVVDGRLATRLSEMRDVVAESLAMGQAKGEVA